MRIDDVEKYLLYVHIAPNKKYYFGITCKGTQIRWGKDGKGYNHQQLFYRAIQKYGWDNFQHIILLENLSKEVACECEKYLISKYQSNNPRYGYNVYVSGDVGAQGQHFVRTEETRQKISNARKGMRLSEETRQKISKVLRANGNLKGKTAWNKGKKTSLATRMLQSESAKKRRLKYEPPMLGKHHTEETKEKLRQANLGKHFNHSQETKDKISAINKGRKYSDEYKQKLSIAHKGKKKSEETKYKMSESHKKFYSDNNNRELARERALKGWETRRKNKCI